MFTGLVEEVGSVVEFDSLGTAARLTIRGPVVTAGARPGDSIAVNGVCLTVVGITDDATPDAAFSTDVVLETLRRSSLGALRPGSAVNLERPVSLQTRLGGHLVQGHVDGTGTIVETVPDEHSTLVRVGLPASLGRYVVEKGSVAVDGVSLTVVEVGADWFSVALIPTTLAATTLGGKQVGDVVNLEVDIVAKYVEKLLAAPLAPTSAPATRPAPATSAVGPEQP